MSVNVSKVSLDWVGSIPQAIEGPVFLTMVEVLLD